MSITDELKTLRAEFSKTADTKYVPEFIISGLEKLGYRTDDLETPKPNATASIRGNEYLVFGAGDVYNKLEESNYLIASILKSEAELSKISVEWAYGIDHHSLHETFTRRLYQEKGISQDYKALKDDFKNGKILFNKLDEEAKKAAQHIFENERDTFKFISKMTYNIFNSAFVGNTINAIEEANKPKRKIKPK